MTQGVNGRKFGAWLLSAAALVAVCGLPNMVVAQDKPEEKAEEKEKPEFKPWAEVSKGFEKVTSTADGKPSFYTLWTKNKDGSMLAELPRGYEGQRHFIALTIASGEEYAGLQFGEMYVYWKRIDNRMVLIEPTVDTRSTGDAESKSSVKNLFTDRVIIDVPIVTMGPSGQPVIDMKDLLVNQSRTFFGGSVNGVNTRIATIKKAKAFPENIEVAYEMPIAGGRLKEFHYSISLLREDPDYKPRHADERLGYFTTVYRDLGKFTDKEKWNRYINRWKLEKRDSKLAMSPPKEPIVFHIDAAVPVRYRESVRRGVLEWNKAFEKVGIVNAVEVYQQDETTGAHMDKDPEDVRYNFIRWLSNDQGTAIGPSRVHPLTGQILDADVVLTDGWIRHFWVQFNEIMPELMMDGMSAETLAWLELHPQWDPRVRLADPAQRPMILAQRARKGVTAYGGHPIAMGDPDAAHEGPGAMLHGRTEYDGLVNRTSQINGLCLAAKGKAFDMATGRLTLEMLASDESFDALASVDDGKGDGKDDKKDDKDKKKKVPELDGIPDWFVQPLLADLVSHEVGHTLGLRHNFKASCQYTLGEINSEEVKGKKPFAGSVMDYIPVNFAVEKGKLTGDVAMTGIGDYDMWVIEYGYTLDDPKDVLKRVGQPGLDYGTDEDTGGVDPRARRYDFSKNPIDYARSQMELATYHRGRLLDKFVKDGDNWSRVRRGYEITLGMQARSLSIMSSWVGGVYINRDKKGDSTTRKPLEVVPASTQREALKWCIDNSFFEESFGLSPEISSKMITDKWLDQGGFGEAVQESTYPIHDRLGGIQASVMTMLLNPTTTRRIFDNEFLVGNDEAITLSEVLDTIDDAVWKELDKSPGGSVKKPYISSLRRGLQSEYVDRLVNLSMPGGALRGESGKAVSTLVTSKLRSISKKLEDIVGKDGTKKSGLDPYSYAHLSEAKLRIDKALDSQYIYNANDIGGGYGGFMFFGQPAEAAPTNK
ncbi:MAG TPA: zinc-dependent metalloprotease [Phycisphaerales bacterium]|nr:zinc-dependent metalloprotease [Phycisphaerales bacterium]